jgi:hypothetical protein
VADWGGITGGRLLVRDLDDDGSAEILHFSHDMYAESPSRTSTGCSISPSASGSAANAGLLGFFELSGIRDLPREAPAGSLSFDCLHIAQESGEAVQETPAL